MCVKYTCIKLYIQRQVATGDQHLYEATSLNVKLKKKQAVYTLLTCLNNLTDIVLKTQKAEQTMLEVKSIKINIANINE